MNLLGTTRIESIMGDTTQWKKGRLLGSGGGGKVWYGMTQEKIEVRRCFENF